MILACTGDDISRGQTRWRTTEGLTHTNRRRQRQYSETKTGLWWKKVKLSVFDYVVIVAMSMGNKNFRYGLLLPYQARHKNDRHMINIQVLFLEESFLSVVSLNIEHRGKMYNNSAQVQVKTLRQTCDGPLLDPAHRRIYAPIGLNELNKGMFWKQPLCSDPTDTRRRNLIWRHHCFLYAE